MGEKLHEDGNVKDERDEGNQYDDKRIYHSFCYNGSQGFRKRYVIVTLQHDAPRKFTDARNGKAHGIREENGIEGSRRARLFTNRFQRQLPSPAAECLCQNAKGERQEHPSPIHLMKQHLFHLLEIEVSVHPIQDATAENKRYANLEYVVSSFFHDNDFVFHWQR